MGRKNYSLFIDCYLPSEMLQYLYQEIKQFEGVGAGACKAFTPWYQLCGIEVGDSISVEFISTTEVVFDKI